MGGSKLNNLFVFNIEIKRGFRSEKYKKEDGVFVIIDRAPSVNNTPLDFTLSLKYDKVAFQIVKQVLESVFFLIMVMLSSFNSGKTEHSDGLR